MLKDSVTRVLRRFTPGFWVWTLVTLIFLICTIMMLVKIFFSGTALTKEAMEKGQRVIVHVASGEIEGNISHTKREQAAPVTQTVPKPAATASAKPADGAPPAAPLVSSSESLAPAPLAAISEPSDKGPIPIAAHDGTLPWKYYSKPYTPNGKKPMVALIITNLGLNKSLTEQVLGLPHNFTLSFSAYASDAKTWSASARGVGFETMIDLPMEPSNYPLSDPGPYGLLEDLASTESEARLHWVISRFPGFIGATAPVNEKLTNNINAVRPTLMELSARGLLFLYLKTPANTAVADLAKLRSLSVLGIDKVLDDDITPAAIDKQLIDLMQLAKTQGYAIGIAHSYPPTLDSLTRWNASLSTADVELVPVSAIAKKIYP